MEGPKQPQQRMTPQQQNMENLRKRIQMQLSVPANPAEQHKQRMQARFNEVCGYFKDLDKGNAGDARALYKDNKRPATEDQQHAKIAIANHEIEYIGKKYIQEGDKGGFKQFNHRSGEGSEQIVVLNWQNLFVRLMQDNDDEHRMLLGRLVRNMLINTKELVAEITNQTNEGPDYTQYPHLCVPIAISLPHIPIKYNQEDGCYLIMKDNHEVKLKLQELPKFSGKEFVKNGGMVADKYYKHHPFTILAAKPMLTEKKHWFLATGRVHGDIKKDNFAVNDAGEITLIDFGTTASLNKEDSWKNACKLENRGPHYELLFTTAMEEDKYMLATIDQHAELRTLLELSGITKCELDKMSGIVQKYLRAKRSLELQNLTKEPDLTVEDLHTIEAAQEEPTVKIMAKLHEFFRPEHVFTASLLLTNPLQFHHGHFQGEQKIFLADMIKE